MQSSDVLHVLRLVFRKSILAVNPPDLVQRELLVLKNKLHVRERTYNLYENCYIVGFGKCVLGMATKVEDLLGSHLQKGIISVPSGFMNSNKGPSEHKPSRHSRLCIYEGAKNNLPDENAVLASKEIKNLVVSLKESDILIVLISGGGSSLLTLPKSPVTLQEKLGVVKLLGKEGANIVEINTVRKKLSILKGGGLANIAYPCKVVALILSDVIGDPLDIIASGPTVANCDEEHAALKVIKKYNLSKSISPTVLDTLEKENSKPPLLNSHVQNILIGNNKIALGAAEQECISLSLSPLVISDSVSGLVSTVVDNYISLLLFLGALLQKKISMQDCVSGVTTVLDKLEVKKHIKDKMFSQISNSDAETDHFCLIFGGEPTVNVTGKGVGGRNQELCLRIAVKLYELAEKNEHFDNCNVVFLSGGTDGIDGPTEAAGAIAYSGQIKQALADNLDPYDFISRNDSHNFFLKYNQGKDLILTGHTGVNVMDIHILLIQKKSN